MEPPQEGSAASTAGAESEVAAGAPGPDDHSYEWASESDESAVALEEASDGGEAEVGAHVPSFLEARAARKTRDTRKFFNVGTSVWHYGRRGDIYRTACGIALDPTRYARVTGLDQGLVQCSRAACRCPPTMVHSDEPESENESE